MQTENGSQPRCAPSSLIMTWDAIEVAYPYESSEGDWYGLDAQQVRPDGPEPDKLVLAA
jgi:hypothetical protein